MPFVGINTDMTKYLPDSSQMKIGMDHMNEAFPDAVQTYTIRVMFRGLDARDKLAIREQLAEIPNVQSVAYEPDSSDYNRDDATLYKLSTLYDYNSDEEAQIERDVAERFAGYDAGRAQRRYLDAEHSADRVHPLDRACDDDPAHRLPRRTLSRFCFC